MFGELALLYCTPRAASVESETAVTLFSLSREMFNAIVRQRSVQQRQKYEEFLGKVEILRNLEGYERSKLCDCLKTEYFDEETTVVQEGENGDRFYLIIQGRLKAYKFNERLGS
jgi:cAMP-dependent protein kinase regulator